MQHKKEILARALAATGIGPLLRRLRPWNGLLVLNYHRIGDAVASPLDSGVFSATQQQFDDQLAWLKSHADVIGMDDLASALDRSGRFVLITFDDGYLDNYQLALPVLRRHAIPATFFITTGFIDGRRVAWWDEISWMVKQAVRREWPARLSHDGTPRANWGADETSAVIQTLLRTYKGLATEEGPAFLEEIAEATGSGRCPVTDGFAPWMTWDQIRELQSAGQSIGAHTVTHPVLARCSREQQQFEITESKRRIEDVLGGTVNSFSYPVGTADAFTSETEQLMQEAGLRWAFNFQGGYLDATHARTADHYSLPRIAMEPDLSAPRFQALNTLPGLFARA
ncbi:Poly-beta-1,6-N-acetyl-D-glucosamine N-deacetylase precursor [Caulifigura coniformis]|uniref:Poly-beta-1,6-N-acetyl-D-glucosamine N-deacetylase n=2 Tax=Caulifigura coniformis TaxID=2527983 RepID=A0A517SD58_9PLAN|nr:Poly-beta-1,6-N-acetyl-D-glucosamine N-deacetylase precursor [Caulifigura coniformis]